MVILFMSKNKSFLFTIPVAVLISISVNTADAFSCDGTPCVSFDADVYPVPFGEVTDFEDVNSLFPQGRSLFPLHHSAMSTGKIQESTTLENGNLVIRIRVTDANFDTVRQDGLELFNEISQDVDDTNVGPLKISVFRDSEITVLGYAGGSTPNKNGLIDVNGDNPDIARQLGSISELAPDAGIFELDFEIRYTDGPFSHECPATATFTSLDTNAIPGSEESRFDTVSEEKTNYCILQGDVLTAEYTSHDELGNEIIVTDSAIFQLRDGSLKSDRQIYSTGHDVILTLTEPDFNLDNDEPEKYTFDLIEWDSHAATITIGELGGELAAFDPLRPTFVETGDSTGIFQGVIEIPQSLQNNSLEKGEEIELEYVDWSPSTANYVGQENKDVNTIIFTNVSPLKQTHMGIASDEIVCPSNMTLMVKHDGSPACVKSSTLSKLLERNWSKF